MKLRMSYMAFAAALLLTSCEGIFEDRDLCPSRLWFDLIEDRGLEHRSMVSYVIQDAGGNREASEELTLDEFDGTHMVKVGKGHIYAFGTVGALKDRLSGDLYLIPDGQECGEIYHFLSVAEATDETCRIPVSLNKEFCTLDITFVSSSGEKENPYYIAIRSGWCGMNISTGKPVKGIFHHFPEEDWPGHFVCRLPRQGGRGLMLDLYIEGEEEGGILDSFDLYSLIDRIEGFSWADESLSDVSLSFDLSRSILTVTVNEWEIVETITITI